MLGFASFLSRRRVALVAVVVLVRLLPGSANAEDAPPHLLRYLEGLDALTDGKWREAAAMFDEVSGAFGRDGRPWMGKGVALVMQGQWKPAADAFTEAANRGFRGREPQLWKYVIGRMANAVFDPSHGISGPRSLGGDAVFSGVPGHMLQGRDDYPTNYASFLYYNMATPIGETAEGTRQLDQAAAQAALRQGAKWFANRARAAPELGRALYQRAEALAAASDVRGALEYLGIVRVAYPDDWLVAALASDCWLGFGRHATARREASLALVNASDNAYTLVRRAAAAARLGRPDQARADLKLARAYNDTEVKPYLAGIENVIQGADQKADPVGLRQKIEALAAREAADADLLEAAAALMRATERGRRYYDEFYTEQIRVWQDQIRRNLKNPAPWAGLAGFIIDEARSDRRGEALESGRATVPYRAAADDTRDLQRALQCADEALRLDAKNLPALMQRARALARLGDGEQAERVVAQALMLAPKDPLALRMQGQFWIERGNSLLMQAWSLRMPAVTTNSWTETRSDGIYRVTQTTTTPPSSAALHGADQLEAAADALLRKADAAIQAALTATRNTLQGDLLAADVAFSRGDLAGVESAAQAALKRDPRSMTAHDILADAYRRAGRIDQSENTRSAGANLTHTTAGWKLRTAWRLIEARDFDAARRALDEAEKLDPADARIDALRGELARLDRKPADARAIWRLALALEIARLASDDQPPKPVNPPLPRDPLESGLAMALRERLADSAPADEALRLLQASAAVDAQVPPGGIAVQMFTAMLPDPDAPRIPTRVPENMAEWLVRAHVRTARILLQTKRDAEGMAEYRAAARFAPAGGTDMIPMIADGRGNRQNSNFAQYAKGSDLGEALIALGRDAIRRRDIPAAQVYLQQAVQASIAQDQRREVNELQMQIGRSMFGR